MIDVRAAIDRLASFAGRTACTDSERRAAAWLHDDLRARGHEAWLETYWVRPQWALSLGLHALLGVAASLVSTSQPLAAAIAAAMLALSFGPEALGRTGLLRRLFYRRATQVVLVEPRDNEAITLLITAAMDTPRRGLAGSAGARRLAARLQRLAAAGRAPGPLAWVTIALVLVAGCAVARELGAEGPAVGAVQLLPTIGLLLALAAAVDIWLSTAGRGANDPAAGVAVALALHDELVTAPADRLSAALVLAGAGAASPLALAAHLRRESPDPRSVVLLELGPCGSGDVVWSTTHPQVAEVAHRAGGRPARWHRPTAARAASRRGIPALSVRCLDASGVAVEAIDEASFLRAVDFCLAFADELSAELEAAESG